MNDIWRLSIMPKIVLVGSVESSYITLQALLANQVNVIAVLGLAAELASGVAGYTRLDGLACAHNIPYHDFVKVNDPETVTTLRDYAPDLIFVVGLSQLIGTQVIEAARLGCIGFHPTRLPVGRGRAAMAWNVLTNVPLAATFFVIDDGVDAGPIIAQVDVSVDENDDLRARYDKLYQAIPLAVSTICHGLRRGELPFTRQDEMRSSYLGARRPTDGVIDWTASTQTILRLIRASASPHPGAFTYWHDLQLRIERGTTQTQPPFIGVPGRILDVAASGTFVVATGDGAVRVEEYEPLEPWSPAIGMMLGYNVQIELHRLRRRVRELEEVINELRLQDKGKDSTHD